MDTLNIKEKELSCPCCGLHPISDDLMILLQMVRSHFGKPLTVTSGYRCEKHNRKVGGAPKSKHMEGIAADIKVADTDVHLVYNFISENFPNNLGVKRYSTWVHVDTRKEKWRSQ